jgi:hypothetical protein
MDFNEFNDNPLLLIFNIVQPPVYDVNPTGISNTDDADPPESS